MRVVLSDKIDRNFECKGFFSDKWKPRAHDYARGSLLMQSEAMRRSTQSEISGDGVRFTSSEPYTALHNEGGTITVTGKMKRFFWESECPLIRRKFFGDIPPKHLMDL